MLELISPLAEVHQVNGAGGDGGQTGRGIKEDEGSRWHVVPSNRRVEFRLSTSSVEILISL